MSRGPRAASRRREGPVRTLVALAALGWAAACGESSSTDPASPPTRLVAVSAALDTVVTGERTDPPILVLVEDALGSPIEGVPVRFILASGQGQLFPSLAVSGSDGIAESAFQAGMTPGTARVRVDIPSATNVAALEFSVLTQASDSVTLSLVEGDGQRAEVGSQLPIPFQVRALTPAGNPAGGIAIAWRIASGREHSPLLTADTTLTDAGGRGKSLLTLGRRPVEYRVEAFAARGVRSDTVRFNATATTAFDGTVRLDSASSPLIAGDEAIVFGRGFSPIPSDNDVRIEGEPAEIVQASGSALTIRVPEFAGRCLPARDVGVRVLVSGDASNGRMIPLQPADPAFDLRVGEVRRVSGPAAVSCLQFPASATPREYRIAIGSASRDPGASVAMRLSSRAAPNLSAGRVARSITQREATGSIEEEIRVRQPADARLRAQTLDALVRGRVNPVRPGARAARTPTGEPALGDTLRHFFSVGTTLAGSCSDTTTVVRSVVRAVGRHVVLAEDSRAPAGGFTADDWRSLVSELDAVVVPVDTAYFGTPDDIDGNGRVVILFTPQVNRLSGPGAGAVGGFFLPLDLAASGRGGGGLPGPSGEVCPASNEAEIIYLAVADPEAEFGIAIPKARAMRNARGLVAHELQHLINAERRVLRAGGFAAAEEVWLDEALSAIAEEAAGLAALELGGRADYTFDQVSATRAALDAFNAFHINNYFNLSLYLFDPASAPTVAVVDPGGLGGLQMRGFGWFLLRWLGDHAGGDERAFFRALATGGQNRLRGLANLELATGARWETLMGDFAATMAADDAGVDGLDDRFRVLSWDFRDVFASLSRNPAARALFPAPFPLLATPLAVETAALNFSVRASTVRYFALVSGLDAPALAIALSTPIGTPLAEAGAPQVTIVRTR